MVRVSLPIVLLATSALVAAEPHNCSNPSAHHLTARDTALSSANHLEARTFLFGNHGVLSWLLGQQKRCPLSFRANGSGKDGYQYDIYGNSCPSHFPRGWLYFGVQIGWAPPLGWSLTSTSWVPSTSASVALKGCTWWAPPSTWVVPVGFTIPSFWPSLGWSSSLWPSKSWQCSGRGDDGFEFDFEGNRCPSHFPSGWLYFGGQIGWAPPKGWKPSSVTWVPSTTASVSLKGCTWWAPPSTWVVPVGFTIPSFWPSLGWSSSLWPSKSWQCSGRGDDGFEFDFEGNRCPSHFPSGWLYFGGQIGWAPPKGWKPSSPHWIPSASETKSLQSCTWWSPPSPSSWIVPVHFPAPSHWPDCGCTVVHSTSSVKASTTSKAAASTTPRPSTTSTQRITTSTRAASSSVKPVTTSKAGTTSVKPSSTSKGATSVKSTTSHAASTTPKKPATTSKAASSSVPQPHISIVTVIHSASASKVTVTKPVTETQTIIHTAPGERPTTVYVTQTITAPGSVVTSPGRPGRPSPSWSCSGKGDDGFVVDHHGNACPSHFPSGWLWFGSSIGWAPPRGWSVPSVHWEPSGSVSTALHLCSWWAPSSSWIVPVGFNVPSVWLHLGWSSSLWPRADFECNSSGLDGWDFDFEGHSLPRGYPVGFKWFGVRQKWQPTRNFRLPSIHWRPPSSWEAQHAVWWSPSSSWHLQSGFKCPRFWNSKHLRGSWRWYL